MSRNIRTSSSNRLRSSGRTVTPKRSFTPWIIDPSFESSEDNIPVSPQKAYMSSTLPKPFSSTSRPYQGRLCVIMKNGGVSKPSMRRPHS